jgi:nitrate reductase gamma subunit
MMLRKRNASVPFLLECAFLFLASAVFMWGLQAKIAQNHANQNRPASIISMAKLSTEGNSARIVAAVENCRLARITLESIYVAAFAFSPLGHHVSDANVSQVEPGPRIPGRYNLHRPDVMRRPPPAIS